MGTTELAAEYARARIAAGWWLVAWVNAEDTGILLAGLAAVADAAGLSGDALRQAADAGLVVRHQLEADGDRCLIVFDNASDPDVVRPFVPAAGAARVLVTGRCAGGAEPGNQRPGGRLHREGGCGVPDPADRSGRCCGCFRGGCRPGVSAAGSGSGRGGDHRAAPGLLAVPEAVAGTAGGGVPDPGAR